MNKINLNVGLTILSISLVISSIILTTNKITYQEDSNYGLNSNQVELTGKSTADQVGININMNSNDVTYNSIIKIGDGEQLFVKRIDGNTEAIKGDSIIAKYFHVSKLLEVTFNYQGQKTIKFFNAPIFWGNKK